MRNFKQLNRLGKFKPGGTTEQLRAWARFEGPFTAQEAAEATGLDARKVWSSLRWSGDYTCVEHGKYFFIGDSHE